MTVQDDGSVVILGSTGEFIGGVAPDWAKDNLGNSVPTWYEVDGNTLVQIVDHDKATEYPVVADPWFGIKLFNGIWRDWYNNDYRYNGNVSAWGATVMWNGRTSFTIFSTFSKSVPSLILGTHSSILGIIISF